MASSHPHPWERQPGEPAKAFLAFATYRDIGPQRSLPEAVRRFYPGAAGKCSGKVRVLERWSSAWRWVERASAWDQHLDGENRRAQEQARREMGERHARAAVALQAKALDRLGAMEPGELDPRAVLAFMVEAAKLERVSRGEPEVISEQRHKGEVTHRGDDFFSEIDRYADAIRARRNGGLAGRDVSQDGTAKPLDSPPPDRQTG